MIDRHLDGIAAYCRPENKVSLGFVEGLNDKIRSSSTGPTACATRIPSPSRSLPAGFPRYDLSRSPTRFPEDPYLTVKGLKAPLRKDTRVALTLVFEKAGTIDVEAMDATTPSDHSRRCFRARREDELIR
jgi:hypothetical protein